MSAFLHFVVRLLEDGRPAAPAEVSIGPEERAAVAERLAEFEQSWRREAPGEAPEFHPAAAVWAAEKMLHACRFLAYRDAGPELIVTTLAPARPELPDLAAVHYSVDLTARFLPEIVRLARAAAADDPLIDALVEWGAWWPLSSVGLEKFHPERTAAIVGHPSLLKIYVDRVLLSGDAGRLVDPAVRAAVKSAVGAHKSAAGKLQPELFSDAEQDEA